MLANSVLLISREARLVEQLRGELDSRAGVRLDVVEDFEEACGEVTQKDLGLIAVHLDEDTGPSRVAHLLWVSSMRPHPVPVVAVSEVYREGEALDLLRMGVADYVSRSDHRGKLGPVISALAQDARGEPAPASEDRATLIGSLRRAVPSKVSGGAPLGYRFFD
jgi:DNA-binding response OmpR family regulator